MAEFLLIHGSGHGAWCWRDLLPLLNIGYHRARAIDLPGHGDDSASTTALTLNDYVDAILDAVEGPTILVGHSLAGMSISQAAQRAPDRIDRLVYLAAWAPKDGQSAADMRKGSRRQPLLAAMKRSQDGMATTIEPEKLNDLFYHDCPPPTLEYAKVNLCPEQIAPSNEPVNLGRNYDLVPRSYIRCMNDRAIPPEYQVEMSLDWPQKNIYTMDCAHSPFFAQPGKLADILFQIAEDL
ncbi:MAG: alpha/beta fold hydrolase [Marinosulfonomonas sp.]|nr:alpha/beta fold hydrolase [Marinosulfonomonas sp.]